jgi:hypothetical protein
MTHDTVGRDRTLGENIERLVARAEPLERMPGEVRTRIHERLAKECTTPSAVSRATHATSALAWFGTLAHVRRPVVVAAVPALVVLAVVFLWPRQRVSAVSWTAVASHFQSMRSLVTYETTATKSASGRYGCGGSKAFVKDHPGRLRLELYRAPAPHGCDMTLEDFSPANLFSVVIVSAAPGGGRRMLQLSPAERVARIPAPEKIGITPPDLGELCRKTAAITEDATRRVGDRWFDGVRLAGFEVPTGVLWPGPRDGFVRFWVLPETALPARMEIVSFGRTTQPPEHFRQTYLRFEWNAEIPDALFELRVPEGWTLVEPGVTRPNGAPAARPSR